MGARSCPQSVPPPSPHRPSRDHSPMAGNPTQTAMAGARPPASDRGTPVIAKERGCGSPCRSSRSSAGTCGAWACGVGAGDGHGAVDGERAGRQGREYAPGPCLLDLEVIEGAVQVSVWDSSSTPPVVLAGSQDGPLPAETRQALDELPPAARIGQRPLSSGSSSLRARSRRLGAAWSSSWCASPERSRSWLGPVPAADGVRGQAVDPSGRPPASPLHRRGGYLRRTRGRMP